MWLTHENRKVIRICVIHSYAIRYLSRVRCVGAWAPEDPLKGHDFRKFLHTNK